MDESKIAELRLILKELAAYLKKQHKATNGCILAVAAIREVLRQNPSLQKSYKENLRDLKASGSAQAHQVHEQTLVALLTKLGDW